MVVEAFVSLVNQSIETAIEEIRLQVAEPLNDDFLNFSIGSQMATCQVLLQRSEEMKNHLVRDLGCRKGVPMPLSWTCLTVLHTCFP
ncbi:hypothetical protein AVEN_240613-1 [Araneus ventricosus]|uniref:Uncharacterized protein n=1 Tax=Araneus ventricosus TaxID=182803 RepID=A0A4Y2D439_ARAVE|nr:hypothetical protein AVEN_240613-1 [Araneus ventricosus]